MHETTILFIGAVIMMGCGFYNKVPSFVAGGLVLMWIGFAFI